MDMSNLTQLFDDLKSKVNKDTVEQPNGAIMQNYMQRGSSSPSMTVWRNKANRERDILKDQCCKHILLDIYCKILPLDNEYIDGNQCQMKSDIDNMLSNKGMSATQYLKSCYESTQAPLLEFILRSSDLIGQQFYEDAENDAKEAEENDAQLKDPKADVEDENIQNQLVDVKNDTEYETFIDKLKEKTINKIVTDVSKIITNKKEEKDMVFDPKPEAVSESYMSVSMDYIQNKLMKENVDIDADAEEEIIGMAIRESTLNQLDVVFNQPGSNLKDFSSRIRFGKGIVVNESVRSYFLESFQK